MGCTHAFSITYTFVLTKSIVIFPSNVHIGGATNTKDSSSEKQTSVTMAMSAHWLSLQFRIEENWMFIV